jgi:hypothetical protein
VRTANLETDTQYLCAGARSEVNVFLFLWDLVDGPGSPDATPGEEDALDTLDLDDSAIWTVMRVALPGATNITLEDFWDGWFLLPAAPGSLAAVLNIASGLQFPYMEDTLEVNDAPAQATTLIVNDPPLGSTLFRDPELDGAGATDADLFRFSATSGGTYLLETLGLLNGVRHPMAGELERIAVRRQRHAEQAFAIGDRHELVTHFESTIRQRRQAPYQHIVHFEHPPVGGVDLGRTLRPLQHLRARQRTEPAAALEIRVHGLCHVMRQGLR